MIKSQQYRRTQPKDPFVQLVTGAEGSHLLEKGEAGTWGIGDESF